MNKLALHRFKNRLRCSSPGSTLVKRIEINRRRVLNPRPTDMRNIYHLITESKLSESGRPQSRSSEVWNEWTTGLLKGPRISATSEVGAERLRASREKRICRRIVRDRGATRVERERERERGAQKCWCQGYARQRVQSAKFLVVARQGWSPLLMRA